MSEERTLSTMDLPFFLQNSFDRILIVKNVINGVTCNCQWGEEITTLEISDPVFRKKLLDGEERLMPGDAIRVIGNEYAEYGCDSYELLSLHGEILKFMGFVKRNKLVS